VLRPGYAPPEVTVEAALIELHEHVSGSIGIERDGLLISVAEEIAVFTLTALFVRRTALNAMKWQPKVLLCTLQQVSAVEDVG
jgi:hypothetical protein